MFVKKLTRRRFDRTGSHTERIQAPRVRFWEKHKVFTAAVAGERERLEKETKYCCWPDEHGNPCGKLAHFMVGRSGFCRELHQAEAYAAQAQWWKQRVKYVKVNE